MLTQQTILCWIPSAWNPESRTGGSRDAPTGADVLIGVSGPNLVKAADVRLMAKKPIVFAMANPVPEISPEEAKRGGAAIIATGRSDYPNQVNNSLVFPGLFRGLLDNEIQKVTPEIKVTVAEEIARMIKNPNTENIIPSIFEDGLVPTIAKSLINFDKSGKRKEKAHAS